MRNTEVWHSLGSRCCGHIGRTQLGHALSQFMLFPTQVSVFMLMITDLSIKYQKVKSYYRAFSKFGK